MKDQNEFFSILDTVDSTNNYAMGQVQAGLAKHGKAWFAKEQYAGRGQRGKTWKSTPGQNIIMSIIVKPAKVFSIKPFLFSAFVADTCHQFLLAETGAGLKIKWPNDIYWCDRKTGGLLIENIYKGKEWAWAVIGIGININQQAFEDEGLHATSLSLATGKQYDPVQLAKELREVMLNGLSRVAGDDLPRIAGYYNEQLYKKNETVVFKKENAVFESRVKSVDEYGRLHTEDVTEKIFEVGEVVWINRS